MSYLNADNAEVAVPCGNCGHEVRVSIGRLKQDGFVDCPECSQRTEVDTNPFEKQIAELNKSLGKFGRDLGKRR